MNIYAGSSWRDSFENRNFKWLDNTTIKWNTEERISPILSMADQWVLRKSIEEPFSPTAYSISELVRFLYDLNNPHINNKPLTFDEEPEPASDAELKELLGIK